MISFGPQKGPSYFIFCSFYRETVERVALPEPLVPQDLLVPLDLLDQLERLVTAERL